MSADALAVTTRPPFALRANATRARSISASVSLEDAFWKAMKEIAGGRDMTLSDLVAEIDSKREYGNLSSAIRLFVLGFYHNQACEREKREKTREMLASAEAPT